MPPKYAVTSDMGRRTIQQDDYCIVPLWKGAAHMFAVFDGHGIKLLIRSAPI